MAEVARIVTKWSGFIGAPGYSAMHFADDDITQGHVDTACTAVKAWQQIIVPTVPTVVTLAVEPECSVFDEATGELVKQFVLTTPGTGYTGGSTGTFAAPVGGSIQWLTGGIHNGHKVRGRTFVVPMAGQEYGDDGTLSSHAFDILVASAAPLLAATVPAFAIWSRPKPAQTDPAAAAVAGAALAVTAVRVRDVVAVLRSRRD